MDNRYFPRPANADGSYSCRVLGERGIYIRGLKKSLFSLPELFADYPNQIRSNAPAERLEGLAQIIAETENLSEEDQKAWINNQPLYKDGEFVTLGTLHYGMLTGEMPTTPEMYGDLLKYKGWTMTIGDSEKGKELQFIAVKINGTQLLVCDRNIMSDISWNQLNEQDLIFGKKVVIDGKKYLLRVPYGGETEHGSCEWSDMMSLTSKSNDIWHWKNIWTICADKISERIVSARGNYGEASWGNLDRSNRGAMFGWRPVLKPL